MQCWGFEYKKDKVLVYKGSETRFGIRLPTEVPQEEIPLWAKTTALTYIGTHGYPSALLYMLFLTHGQVTNDGLKLAQW